MLCFSKHRIFDECRHHHFSAHRATLTASIYDRVYAIFLPLAAGSLIINRAKTVETVPVKCHVERDKTMSVTRHRNVWNLADIEHNTIPSKKGLRGALSIYLPDIDSS